MSARLLKRVLKEQELQKQEEEDVDELEESSPPKTTSSFLNPFDLLNEGDDDDDDDDDDNDEDHETQQEEYLKIDHGTAGGHSEKKGPAIVKGTSSVVALSNKKSKKKKKKKNKEDSVSNSSKVEEPLEAILEDFSIDANSSRQHSGPSKSKNTKPQNHDNLIEQSAPAILLVDPKFLNAENELRRIFGSKVVKSFENSHQAGSSRQVRAGRRGAHIPRKTTLVTPPEHWSRWDGSLSMEFLESKNGQNYFRYVQSPSYSQAQSSFEAVKHMHDLNGIASILMYNPYHLDSLMAMAEYFKFVGEHQTSADAIAKCLYALECAWHPMFTPFQGNCQLKFSHDTNKPLFTTLFMHLKNMDRRGCHRSALEVCKLLLALDSDDPMGALFYVDYLSLRAEEYAWLEEFSEHYSSDSSLWLFPNFSYSLAICRFYLEQQESSKDSQLDEKATSVDLMKQALMLHPSVLKKLVAKTPLKDQAWTKLLRHSFFKSDQTGSETLDHLINIYVERNYIIWRLPDVQKLLRKSAQLVIEELEQNETIAKDWACVRKEAFSSENNEYSHLLVSDFSDTVPTMPPEILQNFMVDARMREGVHIENQAVDPLDRAPARDVSNRNPLAVLFESMLPWVHYGDGDGDGEDGGADEDNQPQGNQG